MLAENSESGYYVEKAHEWIIKARDITKRIGFDKTTVQKIVELATEILLNGNIMTIVEGMNDIVLE